MSKSLNISLDAAAELVNNYAKLHWKIKQFQANLIQEARTNGYVITPAGLKVRSSQVVSDDETVVQQAGRSLGNLYFQGPAGMLTVKAINKIQKRIEKAGYDNDIVIINTIHDAIYAYVRNDLQIIKWYNINLIECMTEDYKENQVLKLKANLDIGYSWADQRELPNNCDIDTIEYILSEQYLIDKENKNKGNK